MESLRTGDHAGGGEGSFTPEQAARREACKARPVPPNVQRQREAAVSGAIGRVMEELNERPPVISMPADAPGRVTA
jgi:hypothetical protein